MRLRVGSRVDSILPLSRNVVTVRVGRFSFGSIVSALLLGDVLLSVYWHCLVFICSLYFKAWTRPALVHDIEDKSVACREGDVVLAIVDDVGALF